MYIRGGEQIYKGYDKKALATIMATKAVLMLSEEILFICMVFS